MHLLHITHSFRQIRALAGNLGIRCGGRRVPERVEARRSRPLPVQRVTLRTIRPAPCWANCCRSTARNTDLPVCSAMARSVARAVRGASGMVDDFAALRVIVSVLVPGACGSGPHMRHPEPLSAGRR